ncbi:class F sortase [Cellulomonas fengjieae]|uniref:class F sortase n=1 Tax=Cellulomonas fengjieae TaxID=2819978 RepID=UPI001AAFA5BC|nr:class F sortase [Cellulomonas fengjieae]MBO3100383.1 class F sortase [Cellulomonas fengjieae]
MTRAGRRTASALVALAVALALGACGSHEPSPGPAAGQSAGPSAGATSAPAPRDVPPATPTRAPAMAASVPVRVEIPTIAVDSELMELGLQDDGTLEVPPGAFPAGWFSGAPTPGELGPAIIVGHIDWVTGPGVFLRLAELAVGDEVRVTRADGSVAVFRTTAVESYPKDAFPTDLVYGDLDHAGLRVVSCGGEFDRSTGHYEDNVIAFAELVV